MISAAAEGGTDFVAIQLSRDDRQFGELIAAAEDHGGEVHLVLLRCDPDELKRRIGNESRVKIGKLASPKRSIAHSNYTICDHRYREARR